MISRLAFLGSFVLALIAYVSVASVCFAAPQTPSLQQIDALWSTVDAPSAIAAQDNTLFIACASDRPYVGQATGAFALLNRSYGRADRRWPRIRGIVTSIAADGSGGWFVAGQFGQVNGRPRVAPIHIRADMSLDNTWQPKIEGGSALSICHVGDRVYLAGSFTMVNGLARKLVAAVDATTGATLAWNPAPNAAALSGQVLAMTEHAGVIHLGGQFNGTLGGQTCANYARISASTGLAVGSVLSADDGVWALASYGDKVFIGGNFTVLGGQARSKLAELDVSADALTAFAPTFSSTVRALLTVGNTIYAGGNFTTVNGVTRSKAVAFDIATYALLPWNPDVQGSTGGSGGVVSLGVDGARIFLGGDFTQVGGSSAHSFAAVDELTGNAAGWSTGVADDGSEYVYAIGVNDDHVAIGGEFDVAGGGPCFGAAAIDLHSGAVLPWKPTFDNSVLALWPDGPRIYVGGSFRYVNGDALTGVLRPAIVCIDSNTGAVIPAFQSPLPPNSVVTRIAKHGNRLYVSGAMHIVPSSAGARSLVCLDATTGSLIPGLSYNSIRPDALELSSDGSVLYVGGDFSELYHPDSMTSTGHPYLAAIDTVTGAFLPWAPLLNRGVSCMRLVNDSLFIGGGFFTVNGISRIGFAELSATTAALRPFDAQLEAIPGSIAPGIPQPKSIAVAGSTMFLAGGFDRALGQPAKHVVAFDLVTGTPKLWFPAPDLGMSGVVLTSDRVVLSGGFQHINYRFHPNLAMFELLP